MPLDGAILGEGIYTPRQAAHLIGGSPQDILRWTRGSGASEPIWKAHYQFLGDATEISFLDLMELRVVQALRQRGVSLQTIRYAIALAQGKFGIERPLSSAAFKTDGVAILMEAVEGDGELVSLSRKHPGQKVFSTIVHQSVSGLDYEGGLIARWRPVAAKHVVIDPKRAFGAPVLDAFGISTDVLFREWQVGRDYRRVSRLYEIAEDFVRDAVRYEASLAQAEKVTLGQGTV